MSADFDNLSRELEALGADTRHVPLAGAVAARRRARQRARNQAVAGALAVVAIVAGGVFAFAQPTFTSAPDFADSPTDTPRPTAPPTAPPLPTSVLLTTEALDPAADWAETDPPAEPWPCAPTPPDDDQILRRSFSYTPGDGRIDQIVVPASTTDEAASRLTDMRLDITTCLESGDFDLDQIWSATGIGDETILIRYWAPPREDPPGEGRLIVSISLARSGPAITSVAHGGFAQDANQPDTTDHAEAAIRRLCAATGGACVSGSVAREQVFPEPAQDLPAWLTLDDVTQATGIEQIAAGAVLPVPEGSIGFVCFESNSRDAGAEVVGSRSYSNALDPGGDSVQQTIVTFGSDQAAREHYATLVAEADACGAEPSLTVENLGTIGGPDTGFDSTIWRATAAGTEAVFLYGLVVTGPHVAFVDLTASTADDQQLRALLTLAGERLADVGQS
jgi:hypothetical protein